MIKDNLSTSHTRNSVDDATTEEWYASVARLGEKTFKPYKANGSPQPAPVQTAHPAAWSLGIADMAQRDVMGSEKYGTRLQPGNGRDSLQDAYEEALDLAVYLRTAIYERDLARKKVGV
jgi:hypothetical protein